MNLLKEYAKKSKIRLQKVFVVFSVEIENTKNLNNNNESKRINLY